VIFEVSLPEWKERYMFTVEQKRAALEKEWDYLQMEKFCMCVK
jgi:hypothetical protein